MIVGLSDAPDPARLPDLALASISRPAIVATRTSLKSPPAGPPSKRKQHQSTPEYPCFPPYTSFSYPTPTAVSTPYSVVTPFTTPWI